MERVVRADIGNINVARRIHVEGNGVRGSVIGRFDGVLVVVLSPVLVGVLILVLVVGEVLSHLLRAGHGLREDEVGAVGELLPGVIGVILAGLPLPNAAQEVLATFHFAKRPGVGLGEVAILAVKVGGTVADQDNVLVLGLNGSILIKDALGGKKASVHVGAGSDFRVHRIQDIVIARNHVGQLLLDVAPLVEEDYADLDVQAVILGLLADLTQELLCLVVDVHLRRGAGLIKHEHNIRRLGLALARERERDLGLQVLVELGRRLLVLL